MNSKIAIKSTLLENGIQSYIDTLTRITLEFRNSEILVGYCQGEKNPADMMTKIFKDPSTIINSRFYRYGDENMGRVSNLEADTVARVYKGTFEFIGIPERFLNKVQEERCLRCADEECLLIRLVQTRKQEKEKKEQDQEEMEEVKKTHELTKLQRCGLGIKRKFQIGMGRCQIDQNYTCMTRLILSKEECILCLLNCSDY